MDKVEFGQACEAGAARQNAGDEELGIASIAPSAAGAIIAAMQHEAGALDVPKPFAQPICLVPQTRVAGTTHVQGIAELAGSLAQGDRLTLRRDAQNRYDRWAIGVFDAGGHRLGFVPTDVNEIPARLMDGGKCLFAKVADVGRNGSWWRIGMELWLDD